MISYWQFLEIICVWTRKSLHYLFSFLKVTRSRFSKTGVASKSHFQKILSFLRISLNLCNSRIMLLPCGLGASDQVLKMLILATDCWSISSQISWGTKRGTRKHDRIEGECHNSRFYRDTNGHHFNAWHLHTQDDALHDSVQTKFLLKLHICIHARVWHSQKPMTMLLNLKWHCHTCVS